MALFLSQIRLAQSPSARALEGFWRSPDRGQRYSAQHNLLWAAFADGPDRERDFLWREIREGHFLTLSARPPQPLDLFEPHQVKDYAPVLKRGNTITFQLRANATRMKRDDKRQRVDIVMDALHGVPREQRAARRMDVANDVARAWLARQGEASGFRLVSSIVEDYSTEALMRFSVLPKQKPQFGILDLSGQLEVAEPDLFLAQIAKGFGRAKSFGCGLMLIRRDG